MGMPDELVLALFPLLSRKDANSLGKTCKRFSSIVHHELRNQDIASQAYRSAIWALYESSNTAALERALVVHHANPNRYLYHTGRARKLVCASLLGHAAWAGRHEHVKCLLEHGADPSEPAGAVYIVPRPEFGQVPIHLALLGNLDGMPYRCPAETVLSLLDYGADGSQLLQRAADLYRCVIHEQTCATPIILRLAAAYLSAQAQTHPPPPPPTTTTFPFPPSPSSDSDTDSSTTSTTPQAPSSSTDDHPSTSFPSPDDPTDIDSAFDFILERMYDPLPALITLVNMTSPSPIPSLHPLAKCVRAMVREQDPRALPRLTALLDCLNFLLTAGGGGSSSGEDPATRNAIPYAYCLISGGWWVADGDQQQQQQQGGPLEDLRYKVFARLLATGVHPDAVPDLYTRPLWSEVGLAIGDDDEEEGAAVLERPDLRFVELLLKYGADPLRRGEDKRCPLDLARERGAERVVEVLERFVRRSPPRPAWWKGLR
jgi:ankyrin repeat protein